MKIILLFTYGMSLKDWADNGLIDREVALYKRMLKSGYKVDFITYGTIQDLDYRNITGDIRIFPVYEWIGKTSCKVIDFLKSMLIPFRLGEVFKGADIIKTNQMNGSWVGVIAKLLYGKKLVVRCGFEWYRNAFLRREKRFRIFKDAAAFMLEWLVYRICDVIIISNQEDADFIKKNFRIHPEKIHVVSNYVDTDLFRPLDVKKKDNSLLYIGKLEKRKNVLNILRAIKETPYRLDIVGDGEDKEMLEGFAKTSGLSAEFLGTVPNSKLPGLINEYNSLVLTSIYENNPKVVLEAMSCGVSVIGSEVPGIRSIIRDKDNGLLCSTDPGSIRESIEAVMQDEVLRKKISHNARRYVLENCRLESILEKENSIYSRLLKRK